MAIDFPTSPTPGQQVTSGSRTWTWSGSYWANNTITGVQGAQGLQGTQGTQGIQGIQGFLGTQGAQGLQGIQGIQGVQGIQGNTGIQGTQGTQGIQGIMGAQGAQGTQGTQGAQGIQGTQGTQGLQGITGSQGAVGTQGITGSQGTQGTQGIQGIQGISGASILGTNNTWTGTNTFTTVSATGLAVSTALADVSFTSTTGTNRALARFVNTGGTYLFGAEDSVGGSFGATNYDGAISVPATRGFSVIVTGSGVITRVSSTGLSVTGTLTSSDYIKGPYGTFAYQGLQLGDASYGLYVGSGFLYFKNANSGTFKFRNTANTGDYVTIDSGGLSVSGTLGTTNTVSIITANGTANKIYSLQTGVCEWGIGQNASSNTLYITNQTGSQSLGYAAQSISILSGGNVGVGTASPVAKLQSTGAAQTSSPTLGSATGGALLLTNTDNLYGTLFGVSSNGSGWIQQQRVDSTAASYALLLQPSGGNVGIGTTSPGYKLEVQGGVYSSSYTDGFNVFSSAQINRSGGYVELQFNSGGGVKMFGNGSNPIIFGTDASITKKGKTVPYVAIQSGVNDGTPSAIQTGDLWWNTDTGVLNMWWSTASAWVAATPVPDSSVFFRTSGGNITGNVAIQGLLSVTGNIQATGTITGSYSDERLKDVSGNIKNALAKVMLLNGVEFRPNDTAKYYGFTSDENEVGVIAQQVQAVMPQVVKPAPFDTETKEDGTVVSKSGENYITVQYERMVPLLIEAIKEQQAQIEKLNKALEKFIKE